VISKTLIGRIVDTPVNLTDLVRVSVPNLTIADRVTYGPMAFAPIVSGHGGTRLPQRGDTAVIAVDEGTDAPLVLSWHRDDDTAPPYTEEGGTGGGGTDVDATAHATTLAPGAAARPANRVLLEFRGSPAVQAHRVQSDLLGRKASRVTPVQQDR
jgi:hypothetical protein